VRGPMAAREVQSPCVPFINLLKSSRASSMSKLRMIVCIDESLHMLYIFKSCQKIHRKIIHTQIGLWTRRWSQKDVFGLGWMPNEVCEIFYVKTHNAWTKRLAWKVTQRNDQLLSLEP
jgi:hypothetical protein